MTRYPPVAFAAALACAAPAAAEVPQEVATQETAAGTLAVTEVAGGLEYPWGMAFLPDGRLLVTEKPGRLRIVSAGGALQEEPVLGAPEVWAEGQGGLLDVAVDPDFAQNAFVWMTFAEPGEDGTAGTALARGRLVEGALEDVRVVWRQEPKVEGPNHFGSRIVFAEDGTLFVVLGERFQFDPAQDLSNTLGVIVRLTRDGEPAPQNPFLDSEDVAPEIWSYGHRNIEAAAIDATSGLFYVAEMGPRGGDELNLIEQGANYGWPLVSWGENYDGTPIPDPPTRPDLHGSLAQWTPVIAPSGMAFYHHDALPEFRGHAFIGGLVSQGLTRVALGDGGVQSQDHIALDRRIRDVEVGPDGALYVLTDREDGELWKLAPQE